MKTKSTVFECCIIELNKIHNKSGNITVVEAGIDLPFIVKRVFYLYDVPSGSYRGAHAHKELHHFIVAAGGCFDVVLDDSRNRKIVELNRPNFGLYIPPGIWVELLNFSSGATSLNLVSDIYSESDYLRDYTQFLKFKNENSSDF